MNIRRLCGFTLIELMITLSVAAIVLTLGVPSFREIIQDNRMTTQANEFVATLNYTRSEAVKRGTRVTACKSADFAACSGSGAWDQGWIVFVDGNNNAIADDGAGSLLKVHSRLDGSTLAGNTPVAAYVSFVPSGFTQLTTGGFQAGTATLCPASNGTKGRSITISRTGRLTVAKVVCP